MFVGGGKVCTLSAMEVCRTVVHYLNKNEEGRTELAAEAGQTTTDSPSTSTYPYPIESLITDLVAVRGSPCIDDAEVSAKGR